jgi:hypothetical protein
MMLRSVLAVGYRHLLREETNLLIAIGRIYVLTRHCEGMRVGMWAIVEMGTLTTFAWVEEDGAGNRRTTDYHVKVAQDELGRFQETGLRVQVVS